MRNHPAFLRTKKDLQKSAGLLFAGRAEGLDSALNLIGTEASGTDVHMARSSVNDCLNTLHVGLPAAVGSSVGVRNLDTESHALAADIAFCHLLHLLAVF